MQEDCPSKILFVQPLRMLMEAEREPCQDQWEVGGQHAEQFLWTSLCIYAILQHPILLTCHDRMLSIQSDIMKRCNT